LHEAHACIHYVCDAKQCAWRMCIQLHGVAHSAIQPISPTNHQPPHPTRPRALCQPDPSDGMILAEGVGRFCDDLGVDPSDIVMVGWCWGH
jgi:hypothetical protein